jgi:hypothetical protein
MTKKTIASIALSILALTLVIGALSLAGCGNDNKAEEKPAPAAAEPKAAAAQTPEAPKGPAAEQAGLNMGEKLAITQHFEEKAKTEITAENAVAELEKLAKEVEADQ